jgi:ABC-2 type transport system ATP-binding protein
MSLLFSSHLLPDVEAVCDHVIVLAQGRLLAQGNVRDLKQAHDQMVEVRVKADPARFARGLTEQGCGVEPRDDLLLVRLPQGRSRDLLWQLAAASGEQIRYLRPQRSTLEEVFLKAVEEVGP